MAMSGFLNWLAHQYEEKLTAFREQAARLCKIFRDDCLHLRSAAIAAELLAGLEFFLEFALELGALTEDGFHDIWENFHGAIREVLAVQNLYLESEDPVQMYLALLAAALLSGRTHVAYLDGNPPGQSPAAWGWRQETYVVPKKSRDNPENATDPEDDDSYEERTRWRPRGACIGWILMDDLYLEPAASLAAAQEVARGAGQFIPITIKTLGKTLEEKGLLVRREAHRRKYTVRKNIQGRRSNFFHLRASSVLSKEWHSCERLEPGHEGSMDDLLGQNDPEIEC
jgi:hypothetical protein